MSYFNKSVASAAMRSISRNLGSPPQLTNVVVGNSGGKLAFYVAARHLLS